MKWLINIIKKNSAIKKVLIYIIGKFSWMYMYIINKISGIDRKKIVFISFKGKSYSDNPRAISEKLREINNEIDIVWLFNDPILKKNIVPDYVRCVKNNSIQSLKELATSRFWVDNFTKNTKVYKSKEQIYIQTWHGDRGFKKVLHDSNFAPEDYYLQESDICDLAIAGSTYGKMQYNSAFKYYGDISIKGYPRNDILIENNEEKVFKIKKKLNIKKNYNIVLYAPTLRRKSAECNNSQEIGEINLIECLSELKNKTGNEWICLTRAHSAVRGLEGIPESDGIIDVSSYEEMSELLLISDMLITDYSSSAGDFALLKRPIILFQNDREDYIEKDRTFYFDIDESPFKVAMNQFELIQIIKNITFEDTVINCKEILEFYGTNETGKASEEVSKFIISNMEGTENEG